MATRKKEKLEGISCLSQKTTPDQVAVRDLPVCKIGRFFSTINLYWRKDFSSDNLSCSKKVRDYSDSSEGVRPLSIADPMVISFLNSGLRRVSTFLLVVIDDAA